jgi:hypothetical protein
MDETLTQKARRFATLKSQAEYFEAKAKVIKDATEKLSLQLYDEMLEEGIDEIRISATMPSDDPNVERILLFPDGVDRIVTTEEKFKANITSVNQEAALEWFRKNGHKSLIKTCIDGSTLNSWITAQKDKNMPIPPSDLVSVFSVTRAKITRARSAKKKGG